MSKKKKKGSLLMKVIFSSSILTIAFFMVIIIACLMILDFFGANITDDYVENNMDYADTYRAALNQAIKAGYGYVPLNRILYFYLENDKLSFYEIYIDNLDKDSNKMMTISDVCSLPKYKIYEGCKGLDKSDQLDVDQNKPFSTPIDFKKITVTSFFMEERIVFGKSDVHGGWDLACGNQTPIKAVCDGTITRVSFPYTENVTDKNGGGGNQIYLECEVDEDVTYKVIYAHLYPGSAKVTNGQQVTAGMELAGVGTTGYSTGPHLHYEVQLNGNKVDGMSLIDFSDKMPNPSTYPGLQPITPQYPTLPNHPELRP